MKFISALGILVFVLAVFVVLLPQKNFEIEFYAKNAQIEGFFEAKKVLGADNLIYADIVSFSIPSKIGKLKIRARKAKYDLRGGKITLEGDVKIKGDDFFASCSKALVEIDREGNLKFIRAWGGIKIFWSDKKAEAGEFFFHQNTAVLSKSPKIISDGLEIRGKYVIIDIKNETVEVREADVKKID